MVKKTIIAAVAAAVFAIGASMPAATAFAKCPKQCKAEFASTYKTCKRGCKSEPDKATKKTCRQTCTSDFKTSKSTCKAAPAPVFPNCSPSAAFVD